MRYHFVFMRPSGPELAKLAAVVETGMLVPVIDRLIPFAEIKGMLANPETGGANDKIVKVKDR